MKARSAVTIRRPRAEVYAVWRDLSRLPEFMIHLVDVEVLDQTRSRWTATAPGGRTVTWDAEIVSDIQGERISWRSLDGADVRNAGVVRFVEAPGDQGTEVHVEIDVRPPAGPLGLLIAKLFGEDPRQQVRDDLRRFKQIVETGQVMRSDGSRGGTKTADTVVQSAAQPAGNEAA